MKYTWWICVIVTFIVFMIENYRGDVSLTAIGSLIIAMIGYWGNRIEDMLSELKEQKDDR